MKFLTKFELKFAIFFLMMSIFFGTYNSLATTCPSSPTCTYTAVSGSNYTVTSGQTLCVPNAVNYNSGTITLSGGAIYVASGGTLDMSRITNGNTGYTISSTSNSSGLILVTTSSAHGFSTGDVVGISGVGTDNYANGTWPITYVSSTSFTLQGSTWTSASNGSGGTAKKFGTVTNCGTISSFGNMAMGMRLYNYGTVPSSIGNNGAGGDFYNYNSNLTISLGGFDKGSVFYNMSGNTATLTLGTLNDYPRIVNYGTMTTNGYNTSGNASGYFINMSTGTLTSSGAITLQGGGTLHNYGTTNLGSNTITVNSNSTLYNYYGGVFNDGTTNMNGGTLENRGTFTSTTLTMSSSSSSINMYDAAKFTYSAIGGSWNKDNPFVYSGTGSSCSYVDMSGFTYSNSRPITTATSGVKICGTPGAVSSSPSTQSVTSVTAATPAVITINNHGYSNGSIVYLTATVGSIAAGYYKVANKTTNTFTLQNLSTSADITSSNTSTGGNVRWSNFGTGLSIGASGCSFTGCSAPLPIELLSFNAKAQNDEVLVTWTSATEENNQYYTVLRSQDGINFESIGIVNGAGNSSQAINYSFVDSNPLSGTSYYKLKQTDFDGKSESFNMVAVNFNLDENSWILYPNPTDGNQLYIKFLGKIMYNDIPVYVSVYDLTGKDIFATELINYTRQENLLSNSNKLSKGVYLVKVMYNNEIKFEKLVVK